MCPCKPFCPHNLMRQLSPRSHGSLEAYNDRSGHLVTSMCLLSLFRMLAPSHHVLLQQHQIKMASTTAWFYGYTEGYAISHAVIERTSGRRPSSLVCPASVQTNPTYIAQQQAFVNATLAASTATYNLVVVRALTCPIPVRSPPIPIVAH